LDNESCFLYYFSYDICSAIYHVSMDAPSHLDLDI